MRTFHKLGAVFAVPFALCVTFVAVASAEEATFLLGEWLVGSAEVMVTLPVQAEGELLLEDNKVVALGGGKLMVLCSIGLDGSIGPNGAGEFNELLSLSETGISSTPLSGARLLCTSQESCSTPEIWPMSMPWKTLLELIEQGSFVSFALLFLSSTAGKPGWYIFCTVLGIRISDECLVEAEAVAEAKNAMAGVETAFSEPFTELAGLTLAICSASGSTQSGIAEGSIIVTTKEGALTVSSP